MKRILVFSIVVLFLSGFLISQDINYDIIKPDSSSNWAKGSDKTITWNKKGDTWPEVKIKLFNFPAMTKALDIDSNIANNGSYLWEIPNAGLSVGKYVVRVKTMNDKSWGNSAPFDIIIGSLAFGVPKDVVEIVKPTPVFKPPKGMFAPKIRKISSIRPEIKAGDTFLIQGSKFGKIKGKVYISSNLLPNKKIEAVVSYWNRSTKSIICKGPVTLNGIKPHNAKFYIITANNLKSNEVEKLVGGWEEKLLTEDAIGVSCGTDGNCNHCNDSISGCGGDTAFTADGYADEVSIDGFHSNAFATIGDDVGDDIYYINLKNGWVLKSIEIPTWDKSSGDEVLTGPTPSFPVGSSIWNAVIHWKVSPNDNVKYRIKIMVEGPIGTHYK